jgi:hypothetical protein
MQQKNATILRRSLAGAVNSAGTHGRPSRSRQMRRHRLCGRHRKRRTIHPAPSLPAPTRRTAAGWPERRDDARLGGTGLAQTSAATGKPTAKAAAANEPAPRLLVAAPAKARLRPAPAAETEIWAFDGKTPGPTLRIKLGETLRLKLENRTPCRCRCTGRACAANRPWTASAASASRPSPRARASNTGSRQPIPARSSIARSSSAAPRSRPAAGLAGILIVEEAEPLVGRSRSAGPGFGLAARRRSCHQPFVASKPEAAAAGRLGSWLTVNGGPPPHRVVVAPGARVRLRLANACNARIMRLRFDGVKAHVVAVDGQPTDTFEPVRSQLPFAPGTRYDLIVDMPEDVGATASVTALIGAGVPLGPAGRRRREEVRFDSAGRAEAQPDPARRRAPAGCPARRHRDRGRRKDHARVQARPRGHRSGKALADQWRRRRNRLGKPLFSVKRGTPDRARDREQDRLPPAAARSRPLLPPAAPARRWLGALFPRHRADSRGQSCTSPSSPTIPAAG